MSTEEALIVRGHHEKPNGRGYPDGLTWGRIPEEALIISVVDVFEALSSRLLSKAVRGYQMDKKPLTMPEIVEIRIGDCCDGNLSAYHTRNFFELVLEDGYRAGPDIVRFSGCEENMEKAIDALKEIENPWIRAARR